MIVKVNQKYRLTKEYISGLTIKPQKEFIEIKMVYADTVVFSDGISTFTDRIINIIPNLREYEVINNFIAPKKPSLVVEPTVVEPKEPVVEPVSPETPQEPAKEPTVEPKETDPTPQDITNPYDDSYI